MGSLPPDPLCWQQLQLTRAVEMEQVQVQLGQGIKQYPASHLSGCRALASCSFRLSLFSAPRSPCIDLPPSPCSHPVTLGHHMCLLAPWQCFCVICLRQSFWFCILGGTCSGLVSCRVWPGSGCMSPACTHGDMGDGAFGAGSGLRSVLGSFSSRGALIGFTLTLITPAVVMLTGDPAASAALVACMSLALCATEGPLSWLGWDCCTSWVLWEVAVFPMGSG